MAAPRKYPEELRERAIVTKHFSYSFALTTSSQAAHALEEVARRGLTFGVKPTLNPLA